MSNIIACYCSCAADTPFIRGSRLLVHVSVSQTSLTAQHEAPLYVPAVCHVDSKLPGGWRTRLYVDPNNSRLVTLSRISRRLF